ncbi:hypothetical protein MRQ36_18685 [Micromonospora sp. R77]|uniref:hypothetical protein n=1 Tax=Micromonospora sp. R77 TaxID=2925836 RepID=UPI001F611F9B|nr:hypothetical protein [Micromonospora sp. R77]MCI4064515.1 hypothetical protein [Micromonospora sp. R77]
MQKRIGRRLTAVLVGAGLTLAGGVASAGPAAAATTGARADVQAGRLVLEPTERGYRGALPVTVTNLGGTADSFALEILEPVAGSFRDAGPDAPCVTFDTLVDRRRTHECAPPLYLRPGERRQAVLSFEVLTATRPYAMRAGTGTVTATVSAQEEPAGSDSFGTVLRSTAGKLRPTRPYVQDTEIRASITAHDATLTRAADGRWVGRVPITVRWAGDAAHDRLWVDGLKLPGVRVWATEPDSGPASTETRLYVPGKRFMPGEERSFDLVVVADAGTPAGERGLATFQVGAMFFPLEELTDADPLDNTATVMVTAVE